MIFESIDNIDNPALLSPLTLAYIGDAVYELYVRKRIICEHTDMPPHKLHLLSIRYVKANAQSNSINYLENELTDEEMAIYKRGRNAKSATIPKNADIADYRRATGFEALLGFLYLKNDSARLEYIMHSAYEHNKI